MTARTAWRGFWAGLLAALAMSLAMAVVREVSGGPSLPELLGEAIITLMPPVLFSAVLDTLLRAAKPTLFVSVVIGQLVVGGLIGRSYAKGPTLKRAVATALVVWVLVGVIGFVLPGIGFFGRSTKAGIVYEGFTLLALFVVYGLALYLFERLLRASPAVAADSATAAIAGQRRRVLVKVGAAVAAVAVAGSGWRVLSGQSAGRQSASPPRPDASLGDSSRSGAAQSQAAPASAAEPAPKLEQVQPARIAVAGVIPGAPAQPPFDVGGLSPEVTPTKDFYTVSKNFFDPKVDAKRWSLVVDGLVERSLQLGFDDIKALPSVSNFYTLQCISNPIGGDLWGNAHWKGVRLVDLLQAAGAKPGVRKVVFHAADDYTDSIVLDRAVNPGTIVAYEMNGAPLEDVHGFPARILVPNIYGMKNVKWVTRIELVDYDFKGFWMERGWSDPAPYQVSSRIDSPASRSSPPQGEVSIAGVAFAGDRGIKAVEVSLDDGKNWQPAQLKPALAPNTWNLWVFKPRLAPGSYSVKVRAVEGAGEVQTALEAEPLPAGATGYHTVVIRVV